MHPRSPRAALGGGVAKIDALSARLQELEVALTNALVMATDTADLRANLELAEQRADAAEAQLDSLAQDALAQEQQLHTLQMDEHLAAAHQLAERMDGRDTTAPASVHVDLGVDQDRNGLDEHRACSPDAEFDCEDDTIPGTARLTGVCVFTACSWHYKLTEGGALMTSEQAPSLRPVLCADGTMVIRTAIGQAASEGASLRGRRRYFAEFEVASPASGTVVIGIARPALIDVQQRGMQRGLWGVQLLGDADTSGQLVGLESQHTGLPWAGVGACAEGFRKPGEKLGLLLDCDCAENQWADGPISDVEDSDQDARTTCSAVLTVYKDGTRQGVALADGLTPGMELCWAVQCDKPRCAVRVSSAPPPLLSAEDLLDQAREISHLRRLATARVAELPSQQPPPVLGDVVTPSYGVSGIDDVTERRAPVMLLPVTAFDALLGLAAEISG